MLRAAAARPSRSFRSTGRKRSARAAPGARGLRVGGDDVVQPSSLAARIAGICMTPAPRMNTVIARTLRQCAIGRAMTPRSRPLGPRESCIRSGLLAPPRAFAHRVDLEGIAEAEEPRDEEADTGQERLSKGTAAPRTAEETQSGQALGMVAGDADTFYPKAIGLENTLGPRGLPDREVVLGAPREKASAVESARCALERGSREREYPARPQKGGGVAQGLVETLEVLDTYHIERTSKGPPKVEATMGSRKSPAAAGMPSSRRT